MAEQTAPPSSSLQREIAIFWDYENVPLPSSCTNATQAAKAIVDTVSPYGRIVDRRLYCGANSQPRDCSSLDSSGFDLVVTPTRNQKESLDKKLIADVLTFAWDSAVRFSATNTKPCVVLLTGDGDYAYTLAKLRDRGIMTIIMIGQACSAASILVETADVALSLEDDVLCSSPSSSFKASKPLLAKSTSSTTGDDELMLTICRSIQNQTANSADGWTDFGQIAVTIQAKIRQQSNGYKSPEYIKQQARNARQQADSNGFIQIGRRKLTTNGLHREIVPWNDRISKHNLSNEVYARVLPKGEQLLQLQGHSISPKQIKSGTSASFNEDNTSTNNKTRTLFLRNLPLRTEVRDFVAVLQTTFDVTVSRARLDYPKASGICNVLVEFKTEADAGAVLQGTNKAMGGKGFYYEGQFVGAVPNTRYNPFANAAKYSTSKSYYDSITGGASVAQWLPQTQDDSNADQTQVDPADDTKMFCRSVDLARHQRGVSDDWINAGWVGSSFRELLPASYLKVSPREQVNLRFKNARNKAIEDGLVEMGRCKHQSSGRDEGENVYVPVALDRMGGTGRHVPGLSTELSFRLLFSGKVLADDTPSEIAVMASPTKSPGNKFIFMNNLPRSTTATQIVQFLETLECPVVRVELEEMVFKGIDTMAGHIECIYAEDASKIIRQAKAYDGGGGLIFCGRRIFAVENRTSPDDIASARCSSNPDMSYTREQLSPLGTTVKTEVTDVTESSSLDIGVVSSASEEFVQLTEANNIASSSNSIQSNNIMRQDNSNIDQKDPFEDLLWS